MSETAAVTPGVGDARAAGMAITDTMTSTLEFLLDDPRTDNDRARAEALRYLLRMVVMSVIHGVENRDPAYPVLARWTPPLTPFCAPGPDFSYLLAYVDGQHTYRISGTRGDCRFLAVGTFGGVIERIASLEPVDSRFHVNDGRGNLPVAGDGSVELRLTADPGVETDVRLPPGPAILMIRYAYYDWDTETSPQLYLEREGAQYPPPPEAASDILERAGVVVDFLREEPRDFARVIDRYYASDPATLPFPALSFSDDDDRHQGFAGQSYGQSHYVLGPDEAVVLEVTPPECWFWGFHLTSQFRESSDIHLRSMSLNGHQAVLGQDGMLRAVIAHADPGVPNWLDTGGRPTGLVVGRYIGASEAPVGRMTVVPFDRVHEHLPVDTPIVTPAERSEDLRRRMLAVHRRHDI